jgi:4-amino-4-deoxy-L-arabinose transferase-like glycosyltransferase
MTTRGALWALIGISTVLRLTWAASLGGFTNEAYYYMFAQHLDWSYFDHPPMVGVVAASGLKLAGGLPPVLGLRLGFILMFAGSTWLMDRLSARCFGPRAGVLAALALNLTAFYGLKIGTLAEPDGPLLFFWLLTLDRMVVAFDAPGRTSAWVGVGLAWGAALLSKYHAVLLPAGAGLYLLLRPSARRCLRAPGPYLALAAGLVLFAPVVAWNAAHGWVSFVYQGGRAGGFDGLQPRMLLEAMVAQVLYLTPWIFAWLTAILVRLIRRGPRDWSAPEAFLTCQAVPALVLFLGVATYRRIMPHWPLIGFAALLPMLGRTWSERLAARPGETGRRLVILAAIPVVLGSLFVAQARTGLLQDRRGRLLGLISPLTDPTVDTIRWDQIAREIERRGLLDRPGSFLFTNHWRFSAELAMAMRRDASVACFHRDSRSFTFWSDPTDWVGRDGIFVEVVDSLAEAVDYAAWFNRIEQVAEFPITRAGVPMQWVRLYRCERLIGPFLFGYTGPGHIPPPGPEPAVGRPALVHGPESRTVR